jgi:acyl-CoA dehydrogenase
MAEGGWLGIAMPEAYGGAALGVTEAMVMMHAVARSSGGMSAASAIHINIFGPHPIVVFGNEEQRQRWLPDLVQGRVKTCFGVTEPDAGLNTSNIKTRADRDGNGYIVNGKKLWTTTAQEAGKIMLLARTTPREQVKKPTDGLTLFYTDLDRRYCDIREIPKMGRAAVDSNEVFFDGLPVPEEDRIGEEGKGFRYILHSLNPERILIGAEAVGIGQNALGRAVEYAKTREVFDRPIGQNQSIQHPLAENWMELEGAYMMAAKAAWLYDNGQECGSESNAAKYMGGEAGFKACTQAVMTHGGMGYAKEYHVERLMREVMIARIAPVSPQLILNYIAERTLGLPKSY